MLRADDLPLAVREALGLLSAKPRGRPKKADEDAADRQFLFQCNALKLPPVFAQWKFPRSDRPKVRESKWRTDFVMHDFKLMIEIDGGIWIKGAHSHPQDIIRNMTKGNDAALLGYTVLHFTPSEVKSGHAVSFTQKVLTAKGWINETRS